MPNNTSSSNGDIEQGEASDGTHTDQRLLNRRGCLRLTGVALASTATLMSVSGTAAAADCERVVVEAGQTARRTVGDGETLSNILFDVSAEEADVRIIANGSNWTIRNIGIDGRYSGTDFNNIMNLTVDDVGGSGLVENVYFGDGAIEEEGTPIFVPLDHAGTLTIRRANFQEWPGNAIYGSAPGREERGGQNGDVRIEECYARNNNIASYRVGTDGSYIRDSVVHVDGDVPDVQGGKENARGVWVKEDGTVDIENSDILLEHPDGSYCVVENDDNSEGLARVIDSQVAARDGADGRFKGNVVTQNVGNDPDVSPPNGVPTSAEEACTGRRDDAPPADAKELTFDGLETDVPFQYSVTVSGDIEKAESDPGDNADSVSGNTATGAARLKQDIYRYTGVIEALSMNFENGQTVSLDRSDSRIAITGPSSGDVTPYTIAVSNNLDVVGPENPSDAIDRGRVAGVVSTSEDTYRYSGALETIDINGISMVRVTPT